jgi:hypothetical protein
MYGFLQNRAQVANVYSIIFPKTFGDSEDLEQQMNSDRLPPMNWGSRSLMVGAIKEGIAKGEESVQASENGTGWSQEKQRRHGEGQRNGERCGCG